MVFGELAAKICERVIENFMNIACRASRREKYAIFYT